MKKLFKSRYKISNKKSSNWKPTTSSWRNNSTTPREVLVIPIAQIGLIEPEIIAYKIQHLWTNKLHNIYRCITILWLHSTIRTVQEMLLVDRVAKEKDLSLELSKTKIITQQLCLKSVIKMEETLLSYLNKTKTFMKRSTKFMLIPLLAWKFKIRQRAINNRLKPHKEIQKAKALIQLLAPSRTSLP